MTTEIFEYRNWWKSATDKEIAAAFDFSKGYVDFLNQCKTEREVVAYALDLCQKHNFVDIDEAIKNNLSLTPGTKVYRNIRGKSLMMAIVGQDPADQGLNIVAAHVDSPRLDFKQTPLYEDTDMVLAKTHYYGGIKKYQWVCIPLALHGVVVLKNGDVVEIQIGDRPGDPCFVITDLLPHLAQEQMNKKMSEAVTGEGLNVVLSSMPLEAGRSKSQDELIREAEEMNPKANKDVAKDPFKANLLRILWETYGIGEADLVSAEIEVVPAMPARDIGFDRSMVGGYGQDDRVCSYAAIQALLDHQEACQRTTMVYLSDKEEVGSMGNTGAQSAELSNFIAEFCALTTKEYSDLVTRRCIRNSAMLSADVSAAVDPNYKEAQDKHNANYFGKGVVLKKYTGARGKSGANDANPEFIAALRQIFDQHRISWQTGELGKVDLGGGGTIAQYMANLGMQVMDCGVPLMSMHSPYELTNKADIYNTYLAYAAFLTDYR
jgi:aspartyl aminopeptidase